MNLDSPGIELLQEGDIVACQLTPTGSNYTFAAQLQLGNQSGLAIYKPMRGEVPLWDFPSGTLYKREYASYLLSELLGWDFIPYTIIRDGPHGIGSVQQFIDHHPHQNYYTLTEQHADQLRVFACFDLVANNTDRKASHVLLGAGDKLWGIDHGLTFHSDIKIRTCIWDFAGEPIPEDLLAILEDFCRRLARPAGRIVELLELLLPQEVIALHQRLQWVLAERTYPGIPGRRYRR